MLLWHYPLTVPTKLLQVNFGIPPRLGFGQMSPTAHDCVFAVPFGMHVVGTVVSTSLSIYLLDCPLLPIMQEPILQGRAHCYVP